MEEINAPKKVKATLYMTKEDEQLLYELVINRLKRDRKTDRSALLCEGLSLLHEQELANNKSKK